MKQNQRSSHKTYIKTMCSIHTDIHTHTQAFVEVRNLYVVILCWIVFQLVVLFNTLMCSLLSSKLALGAGAPTPLNDHPRRKRLFRFDHL